MHTMGEGGHCEQEKKEEEEEEEEEEEGEEEEEEDEASNVFQAGQREKTLSTSCSALPCAGACTRWSCPPCAPPPSPRRSPSARVAPSQKLQRQNRMFLPSLRTGASTIRLHSWHPRRRRWILPLPLPFRIRGYGYARIRAGAGAEAGEGQGLGRRLE